MNDILNMRIDVEKGGGEILFTNLIQYRILHNLLWQTHAHAHAHTHKHTRAHARKHARPAHLHARTHARIHAHTYTRIHAHARTDAPNASALARTHACMHAHTHTNIHTPTLPCLVYSCQCLATPPREAGRRGKKKTLRPHTDAASSLSESGSGARTHHTHSGMCPDPHSAIHVDNYDDEILQHS